MSETSKILVVGAGHAGIEAALAAARCGVETTLVTSNLDTIGAMPCNPSIGGQGKGQLVREIDSLGGEMGAAADETSLQGRMLNTRKGLAVQAARVQSDKEAYHRRMRGALLGMPNLRLVQGQVCDMIFSGRTVSGITTAAGEKWETDVLILAPGTFLRGLIHIGPTRFSAGRAGEPASIGLGNSLESAGLPLLRFKTGTPPRIDRRSIRFDDLERQEDEPSTPGFSLRSGPRKARSRLPCFLTRTNRETHDVIRTHLHESALISGQIKGTGPRYCPSIEDKVVKFPDKESHKVFLEPEGEEFSEIYLQGMSTSLPEAVQELYVRTLPGLENARISRPGYAVEYDIVDPADLWPTMVSRRFDNLFLAGQVNGTSGYEEAAAQGILAGINAAALAQGKPPLILAPESSFIGLMVHEITTRGIQEPYRIFTSRSPNRLNLRMSNAEQRLAEIGEKSGSLSHETARELREREKRISTLQQRMDSTTVDLRELEATVNLGRSTTVDLRELEGTPNGAKSTNVGLPEQGEIVPVSTLSRSGSGRISLSQFLKRPDVTVDRLVRFLPEISGLDPLARMELESRTKYSGYIAIQEREAAIHERYRGLTIPPGFLEELPTAISAEARLRIRAVKPATVGEISDLPGVRAGDLAVIITALRKLIPPARGEG